MTDLSTDSEAIPTPSYIRLELFPASVTPPPSSDYVPSNNTKVIVTDSYLLAFHDSPTGPQLVLQEDLIDFQGNSKIGYTAQTPSGTYHIIRSRGCGCGSRLRGFRPYRSIPIRGAEYV